jgi:hypothetical protein
MNNFDCTVSLGYNCYPKLFENGIRDCFFDDIATPAWAIKELLINNFSGFFDKSKYNKMQIFDKSNTEFLTNTKYYIRFTNSYQINNLDPMFNLFNKKKTSFLNKLNSDKKILFIRYEEPIMSDHPSVCGNRIIYPEYDAYYKQNELYHMRQLSLYLRTTYPNLKFHIMLIGNSLNPDIQLNYDNRFNIFTIPNKSIDTKNYKQVIDQIFIDHENFINFNLKK